jgi:hypothetical protein
MDQLVRKLRADYPTLSFSVGDAACWSPGISHVYYTLDKQWGAAGLFHELAHALLGHSDYRSDMDLLAKEIEAWEKARVISGTYGISLDENHLQDCLDTYRDWLHKRSTCPTCNVNGLQTSLERYSCVNCGHAWNVSSSRLCRPYRRSK